VLHRSIFEAVASVPGGPVTPLLENRRMNDVLTGFAAELVYGPGYVCFDAVVAGRRLRLAAGAAGPPTVADCLDPAFPLVVGILEGVRAARENPVEAALVADLVMELRTRLLDADGRAYSDDAAFFGRGVFVVCPHRAQNRLVRRMLADRRRPDAWTRPPFVDTVDKMQGREADAVIVGYGVSDPEGAAGEADFIYGLNRLNVAVTRARGASRWCCCRRRCWRPPRRCWTRTRPGRGCRSCTGSRQWRRPPATSASTTWAAVSGCGCCAPPGRRDRAAVDVPGARLSVGGAAERRASDGPPPLEE
jgi:hypothetical protein